MLNQISASNQNSLGFLAALNNDESDDFLCFDYSALLIGESPELFNAIQIQPVGCMDSEDGKESFCESEIEDSCFIGVYLHRCEGGIVRVGDFGNINLAESSASEIGAMYGWPIYNFVR